MMINFVKVLFSERPVTEQSYQLQIQLRLLTHVGFFRQNCLILSEVSLKMEMSKNLEKNVITVQQKFTFRRGLTVKTRFLKY